MKILLITLALLAPSLAFSEQMEKVSKVDGQLVKVGEKNDYEYAYKKWNVGLNAFVLPANVFSVSGSYAFTEHLAARVGVAYDADTKVENTSVSFGVPIYFKKVYNGFFVEPGVDSKVGLYTAGGYHWMWDSGFNAYIGLGLARRGGVGLLQVAYAFDTPSKF